MAGVTLGELLQQLKASPLSFDGLTWEQVIQFVTLASKVKNDIILTQPASMPESEPPAVLPPSVAAFLGDSCKLAPAHVENCWKIMKGVIWTTPPSIPVEPIFAEHGHQYGLGMYRSFYLYAQY
jgi:hypothetical protein